MDFEALQDAIKTRFWMCNVMSEKEADDYAAIAVHQLKKHMGMVPFRPDHSRGYSPTNPGTLAAIGETV